ncbi:MAG TPA: hypothetical protein VF743_07970, partial [Acidimicrobiales bacterium]
AAGRTVAVELRVTAGGVGVVGRATPPAPGRVVAVWPQGSETTEADGTGAFRLDDLPRRPLSFVVEGDPPLKTGWVVP